MLVEKCVQRLNLPEFAKVAHLAGFHARLASAIDECAAAGCDVDSLRRQLPAGGVGRALAEVYAEVNRELEERKLGMRSTRLIRAAARIQEAGAGGLKTIWLDGFFTLTDAELAVVKALAGHADVTVTLPSAAVADATRARLLSMGFSESALTRERIFRSASYSSHPGLSGKWTRLRGGSCRRSPGAVPFTKSESSCARLRCIRRLLRATLERFGIPARFYFDLVLMEQPAVRFLAGALDAMLGGWDHAQTLTVMKLAPGAGISAPMDRFDFEVRTRMPGNGLEPLRQLAVERPEEDKRLRRLLDRLAELDAWRTLSLKPAEWVERMGSCARSTDRRARAIE